MQNLTWKVRLEVVFVYGLFIIVPVMHHKQNPNNWNWVKMGEK